MVPSLTPTVMAAVPLCAGVAVTLDRLNHAAGKFGLRLRFENKDNPTLVLATQTVPVAPQTTYCLSFQYKTDSLQSLSTPVLSVQDAADEKRLAVSTSLFPNGTQDWQAATLRFTTKPETEAITVRSALSGAGQTMRWAFHREVPHLRPRRRLV